MTTSRSSTQAPARLKLRRGRVSIHTATTGHRSRRVRALIVGPLAVTPWAGFRGETYNPRSGLYSVTHVKTGTQLGDVRLSRVNAILYAEAMLKAIPARVWARITRAGELSVEQLRATRLIRRRFGVTS